MGPVIIQELLILLALIVVNGVFAGAEIAVVSMRPSRVRELAEGGSHFGQALRRLREDPERFLATVQIGITVASATAAAFGGVAFAESLAPLIEASPHLAPHARAIALGLVVVLVSFLTIVLGELVPKSLALRGSEGYARLVAGPLLGLSWLARPAVWILARSSNAVLRLFRDRTSFIESRLSIEELRGLVDEASQGGSVGPEAGKIASRALEFASLTSADVMVHRRFVVGLPVEAGAGDVRKVMLESGHRRTPVYSGSLDHVLGYVSWRDILQRVWENTPLNLAEMMRPCHFVPETTVAPELLETMRSQRLPMAIVVDEHGGMAGIVTLEDLVEEFVGEIVSEHDSTSIEVVKREPDGSALVLGTASIREVSHQLEIRLDEPEYLTTIAGLCIELAGGRIPRTGEVFRAGDGSHIEVVEATVRRVRRVRIRPRSLPRSVEPAIRG